MVNSLVVVRELLSSCIGGGGGLFLNSCGLSGGLLHMRNAVSSGVPAGGLSIVVKAGSTLSLIPDTLV